MSLSVPVRKPQLRRSGKRLGDLGFRGVTGAAAVLVIVILIGTAGFLIDQALPAMRHYGVFSFLGSKRWAPSEATTAGTHNPYGILQFVYGTLVTSFIGMLLAVPASVAIALYITDMAPKRARKPLSWLIDLLAAIPSVVYGFWGIFAFIPAIKPVGTFINRTVGKVPLIGQFFAGPFFGYSYFVAGLILAIMVLPITTAICREVFATTPIEEKEAALAMGATRWEMLRIAVLPRSRSGIVGASILGFGRAVGETIAVTMVIGNNVLGISKSILGQGATMASVIANEFTEANQPYHLRSLFVVAFWLLLITLVVNVVARLIINRSGRVMGGNL
jgi:phosphate transport system permease protein